MATGIVLYTKLFQNLKIINQKGAATLVDPDYYATGTDPKWTFHPLIIMLLAETEVKKETKRIFALLQHYWIILQ